MAEHQRIHPVNIEPPPPSAPPAPPSLASSQKSTTTNEHPPPRRSLPVSYLPPPNLRSRRRRCCRCLCWTLLALALLLVAVAATAGILYLVFDPKLPKYSVDRLRISNFTADGDGNATVIATLTVTITALNPNKGIGIYYKAGSDLGAWFAGERLCSGSLPAFYQGHRNTTVLHVPLTGETRLGSELLTELQRQQQRGTIPLGFQGNVPVRVKFGGVKLWTVTFKVRCDVVVESLSSNADVSLRSSSCRFKLKL